MNCIIIDYKESYEYLRELIREAINSKFKNEKGNSYLDIFCTVPEKNIVIVRDWENNQYYEVEYIQDKEEITLGELVEADQTQLYETKKEATAMLAASKPEINPVGKGWGVGIHKLFINKKPARLLVQEETIKPTFDIIQAKLEEGRVPIGIDHLDENILKENKILAKMDPLDVGDVKEVKTNGKDIYITDSTLTNPAIQELHGKGELPAFSMVATVKAHKCERGDVDYILDNIEDVKRFDFVEQGGCQTCKVGEQPDELILASKLSMEVNNMVNDPKKNDPQANPAQDPNADPTNDPAQDPQADPDPQDPEPKSEIEEVKEIVNGVVETVNTIATTVQGIVEGKIEAKLPEDVKKKLDNVDKIELEAKKSRYSPIVDKAIQEGRVLPVDREMLIDKGVADDNESEFKQMMAKRPVIVDLSEKGKFLEAKNAGDKKYDYEQYKKDCEEEGIKP